MIAVQPQKPLSSSHRQPSVLMERIEKGRGRSDKYSCKEFAETGE